MRTTRCVGPARPRPSCHPTARALSLPADDAQVTFRVAKLLNAEKLVLSERCHPRDEAEYEGMVLFLDNASHIIERHRHVSQSGEWLALAQRASARFREHFRPSAVFRRAGIYQQFALKLKPGG